MTTATQRWAALLLLAFVSAPAFAQADPLGDEFIFFVDGTNVLVPSVEGSTTVTDPLDATNIVARFAAGAWTESGFAWARNGGVDAAANVGATYGASDTLYFRMLSDVANAGGNVSIMLNDITNDSGISRADAEAGGDADYLMRLIWPIPVELHDGQWHTLAIPLPPATFDALQAARDNGELMDTIDGTTVTVDVAANLGWRYTGAWSTGGFGIGEVGGFSPGTTDPLWEEFQWDQLYRLGPFWDNNADVASGPIYLDDVYIGGPSTDISIAADAPPAMTSVNYSADGNVNRISWSDVDGSFGYNVYASLTPITNVMADGVVLLKRIANGQPNELVHPFESHPGFDNAPIYYAVTTLSQFGVENQSVAASAGSITNPGLTTGAFIRQLTEAEANNLFDDVANGNVSDANFPADQPVFSFDSNHRTITEGSVDPTDSDVSARIKIGYSDLEEWFVYGEITDDTVVLAPEGETGGNTYLYDSIELEIGHYDVRTTDGGDRLVGSPHESMARGDEPDYQIRITGRQDVNGDVIGSSTWIAFSLNEDFENSTIVEKTATGWKFLSLIPMDQIQAPGDVLLPVPAANEVQLIPFTMSINDADETGQRETQIVYSIKPNVTNQWYQTPTMWEVIGIAGRDVAVANEDNALEGFSLAQTMPNPASGVTQIAFTLGAPSQVQVEVFNTLGQRVALVADAAMSAGAQSVTLNTSDLASGVYVYRLTAGGYVATRRMTVVR